MHDYAVRIVKASFPSHQMVTRPTALTIAVRNTSGRRMPELAITLDSLFYLEKYPHLSDARRPIWALDLGPGPRSPRPVASNAIDPAYGGATAYVNTWALGPLGPGATRTFTWQLTPLKPGLHQVRYTVAGGLSGKARAVLADGATPTGRFVVDISSQPGKSHVNPETGGLVAGAPPVAQGPVGAVP